jgi:glycosyltransferase involved in cell wall biosynthesis
MTLNGLKKLKLNNEITYEVIVVDNNSTDSTRTAVMEYQSNAPYNLRYVFEKDQGLSHARNRGVKEAQGEIIAFTDDDVVVDEKWLNNLWNAFHTSNAACIGGKIFPVWEIPRPDWLRPELYNYLALLDMGDEVIRLNKPSIWGANFSVKADCFNKYGYFNTNIGRKPGKLYAGEETIFIEKIINGGEDVYYYPDIIVHHYIPRSRINKEYFKKWKYDEGELNALKMGLYQSRNFMGVPLYALREALELYCGMIWKKVKNKDTSFKDELLLAKYMGFVIGRIKYKYNKQ